MLSSYLLYGVFLLAVILIIAWFNGADDMQQDEGSTLSPDTGTLVIREDTAVVNDKEGRAS